MLKESIAASHILLLKPLFLHEDFDQPNDFFRLLVQGEMSSIENVDFSMGIIFQVSFATRDGEGRVIATPNYQKRLG